MKHSARVQFASLVYSTSNIGDDIQGLASRRALPRVDVEIDRERMDEFIPTEKTAMILNGWWAHRSCVWPPHSNILPLLISLHIARSPRLIRRVFSTEGIDFARRFGPVGCRDLHTLRLFEEANVEAYFSGCLTLTFSQCYNARNGDILFVDWPMHVAESQTVSPLWWESIPISIRDRIQFRTHRCDSTLSQVERTKVAKRILDEYKRCSFVVTTRLHCALPCLAFGTPVLLIRPSLDPERLSGLDSFMRTAEQTDIIKGNWNIDWESPPSNPYGIESLRQSLLRSVSQFITSHTATRIPTRRVRRVI